jgi:copper/silver efflux system protein
MQRIAVPMIGGMVSSTLLTLIVIPAIYDLIKGVSLPKQVKTREAAAGPAAPGYAVAE